MKKLYGQRAYVQSAGVKNDLEIDGFSIAVCAEMGIELDRHRSRSFDEMQEWGDDLSGFDLVVSLSPGSQRRALDLTRYFHIDVEYWPIIDPSGIGETREAKLEAYRRCRDQIENIMLGRFGDPSLFSPEGSHKAPPVGSENEWRDRVNARLEELESYIEPIVSVSSLIGHNNPPKEEESGFIDRIEWLELQKSITDLKKQTVSPNPNVDSIARETSVLRRVAESLTRWMAKRAEKVLDAGLIVVGTALGATAVLEGPKLHYLMTQAMHALEVWLTKIPFGF